MVRLRLLVRGQEEDALPVAHVLRRDKDKEVRPGNLIGFSPGGDSLSTGTTGGEVWQIKLLL